MRLLVTRSQPDAVRTALALQDRGHDAIVAPLFEIDILSEVDPDGGPWDAILLTSTNALWGIAGFGWRDDWRDLPIFAVGERTAQAARDSNFTAVTSAGGNVDDLADLVAARLKPPARLLYLAGEERAGDLAGVLRAKNFIVDTVVVYRFVVAETLPTQAAAALTGEIDGVLHYLAPERRGVSDRRAQFRLARSRPDKARPLLSVRPGCRAAHPGGRREGPHRGAAGRSRIARAVRLNRHDNAALLRLIRHVAAAAAPYYAEASQCPRLQGLIR